jgi:polyisoprenoid-binding protein YceI
MSRRLHQIPTLVTVAAIALVGFGSALAAAEPWHVDPNHSQVSFSVKHFLTPVEGKFDEFDIALDYDPENPTASSVVVTIPVASVNTGNERRDGHLRTADFFDAGTYPEITFKSTSVKAEGDRLIATGPLTIRGVTREIELPITLLGVQELPEGMREMFGGATLVAGFRAETSIERGDFGVGSGSWAATVMVGGTVDIEILVEARNR